MSPNVCPSCNTPFVVGATFCDNCGMDLRSLSGAPATSAYVAPPPAGLGVSCPNCGADNVPGAAFCENCGMQLPPVAPSVPSLPTQAAELPPSLIPGLSTVGPYAAPAASGPPCPVCGFVNVGGAAFCENCGAKLGQAIPPAQPAAPNQVPATPVQTAPPIPVPVTPGPTPIPPQPQPASFVTGRLVVFGPNTPLAIPVGKSEVTIGREDPVSGVFPDINLDPFGGHDAGVGRQHAKLVVRGGQVCLIDQNSVNGTFVNKQKITPDQPVPLKDADELRLGRIVLNYYTS